MRSRVWCDPVYVPVIMAIAVVACTGACTTSGGAADDRPGPPAITHQEARKEYLDEAAKWTLPAGWRWPDGAIYTGQAADGAGMVFEPNTGRVDSTHYWFCAWSRTLLSAGSAADRATALKQVLRLPETSFYKVGLLQDDKTKYDTRLAAAKAGDLRPLTEITEPNCPGKP